MTPTLSVEAIQLRLIWLLLMAAAVRPDGAEGGCVSGVEPTGVFMSVWIWACVSGTL